MGLRCDQWCWLVLRGLTSVTGPQAEGGLTVELFYACWPCGGVKHIPLVVPGGLVVWRQLTLHIQVGHGCHRERNGACQTKLHSVLLPTTQLMLLIQLSDKWGETHDCWFTVNMIRANRLNAISAVICWLMSIRWPQTPQTVKLLFYEELGVKQGLKIIKLT